MHILQNFDWIGRRATWFAISGALIAASIGSIVVKGFNYGIDFTGGSMVVVTYEGAKDLAGLRGDLEKAGYPEASPQSFADGKESSFAVFFKGEKEQDAASIETFLQKLQQASTAKFRVDRKEFVGPTVGRHLKRQALMAISLALLAIVIYVAFRFDNPLWGAAGVAAIAHDVTITAGIFSLLGLEVDLVIVAAFLTIAGYSINDTIVIFDRMRENMRLRRSSDLGEIINLSINEMMSRTMITNGLVLAVVLVLFLFGGKVIHNFAFAMTLGAIVGTYSTVALATPLVYQWQVGRRRQGHQPPHTSVKPVAKPKH